MHLRAVIVAFCILATPAAAAPIDPDDITVKACLAAVGETSGSSDLEATSKDYSEANSAVMIAVGPDKVLWRCLVSNDGQVVEVTLSATSG